MGTAPKGWDSERSEESLPPHEDFLAILTRSLVDLLAVFGSGDRLDPAEGDRPVERLSEGGVFQA